MDQNAKRVSPKAFNDIMIDTMIESAQRSVDAALQLGLGKHRIIVSVKMSEIQDMIAAYERLAPLIDVPIHLGLTEAGNGIKGLRAQPLPWPFCFNKASEIPFVCL